MWKDLVVYGAVSLCSVCCDLSVILGKKNITSIKFHNPWSLPHFSGIVLLCKVFLKVTYFREMWYLLFTTNRLKRKKRKRLLSTRIYILLICFRDLDIAYY